MSYTTSQLATYVEGELCGDSTVVCTGATIDSRDCATGNVFFALIGEHADGHSFIEDAIVHGCCAIVVEKHCDVSVPYVVVTDVRKALFCLAVARRSKLHVKCVLAITGSVGKTTTKDILATLLGDNTTSSKKSFNNDLGVPLTILEAEKSTYLVAEIGANDVGEIGPLAKLIQPDIAILTSVDKAHLAGFKNKAIVLQEKSKLLQSLPSHGYAIVPDTIDLTGIEIDATVVTVGTSLAADVQIAIGITDEGYGVLEIESCRVELSLLGEHNATNVALAVIAASFAKPDVSISELLQSASKVTTPKGRLRRIDIQDTVIFDDTYNANPASMVSALQFFSAIQSDRKILILGDMLELGVSSHAEHRAIASHIELANADVVFLVGEEMEAASQIPACMYEPLASDDAINRIASFIQPNDTVLIKGSRGLRLERIIEKLQRMKVSSQ